MEEYDYDVESQEHWKQVRRRNLVINIAKTLIERNEEEKDCFTKDELKQIFGFKEYDFAYITNELFAIEAEKYILRENVDNFIKRVIASHYAVAPYLPSAEATFLRVYGRFYDDFAKNPIQNHYYSKYRNMFDSIKAIIPILHWSYLPVFNRYLIYNRDVDPEREMIEFYDHIDCLNDLLEEIRGKGIQMDNSSDNSLNRDILFCIYSRKRKCMETHVIKRTIDGWYCKFPTMEGACKKDGEGVFIDYLKSEFVFYPYDGVVYALNNLWGDADDGEIAFDELDVRINQIANWINETDKVLDAQPEWLNYHYPQKYQYKTTRYSKKGAETLDKEMRFDVYCRRWGHKDTYTMKRTKSGWYCVFLAIDGDCKKNGEGGLFNNLKHDSIFFPQNGVEFAFEMLWDESNLGVLNFAELSKRIQEVADWISCSEKSVLAQPEWVYYY